MTKAASDVERPVRIQVSITEEAGTQLEELARLTGLSRNLLGAMALQVGITIVQQSMRHAMGAASTETIVAELPQKVSAAVQHAEDAGVIEE